MKTRNIIQLVLFGLILVVAIVGVLYGVLSHKEPGLMHEGKAWERLPLNVSCAGYVESRNEDCETVRAVIERINGRLGFTAYQMGEGEAPIQVTIGVPHEEGWMDTAGDAELSWSDESFTSCKVRTSNTGTSEMLFLVLHHELGHCLDLAHDDFEQSIMRPNQTPTPDRTIPPWISDADRATLRDLYGF